MSNTNEYGELAPWDTTSRKYRKKIKRLTRRNKRYPINAMSAYQVGLLTWEHSRAEMGIKSDPTDPRWGRFFVSFEKRSHLND
jgi:hypothetical protein